MKDKTISLRLKKELYNELISKCELADISVSEFMRKSIFSTTVTQPTKSKDMSKIIGSLNSIGNNINQISRTLNIANKANKLDKVSYDKLHELLSNIDKSLSSFKC